MDLKLYDYITTNCNKINFEDINRNVIPDQSIKLYNKLSYNKYTIEEKVKVIMENITLWQNPKFFSFFPSTICDSVPIGNILGCLFSGYSFNDNYLKDLELNLVNKIIEIFNLPKKYLFSNGGLSYLNVTLGNSSCHSVFLAKNIKQKKDNLVAYITDMSHNHIEKSLKLNNIKYHRKISTTYDIKDKTLKSNFEQLEETILNDIKMGLTPFYIFGVFGSTQLGNISEISKFIEIKKKYDMALFLDGAYGGSYLILERNKHLIKDFKDVDFFAINFSKTLGIGMISSLFLCNNRAKYFSNLVDNIEDNNLNNYKLTYNYNNSLLKHKVLFDIFGVDNMRKYYEHLYDIKYFTEDYIIKSRIFELVYVNEFTLVNFRYANNSLKNEELNKINKDIINRINENREYFIVGSEISDIFYIRLSLGNNNLSKNIIRELFKYIETVILSQLNI